MNLRAPSGEREAKNRCTVGHNYEQRFFSVRGYLVSLNSCPKQKYDYQKPLLAPPTVWGRLGKL
jgi:hypothetical protein